MRATGPGFDPSFADAEVHTPLGLMDRNMLAVKKGERVPGHRGYLSTIEGAMNNALAISDL